MPALSVEHASLSVTTDRDRGARAMLRLNRIRPADLFDAWLFAEADATLALRAWKSALSDEKGDAYAAYVAALDREATATGLLQVRLGPAGA
jgi:hypothetical protein